MSKCRWLSLVKVDAAGQGVPFVVLGFPAEFETKVHHAFYV